MEMQMSAAEWLHPPASYEVGDQSVTLTTDPGTDFWQMRVFHLHRLGETTAEMGRLDPPAPPEQPVRFGLYACSPLESSFEVRFDHLTLEECRWHAHG